MLFGNNGMGASACYGLALRKEFNSVTRYRATLMYPLGSDDPDPDVQRRSAAYCFLPFIHS